MKNLTALIAFAIMVLAQTVCVAIDGNSPLHLAALRNDAAAVDSLLAGGADAGTTNEAGATPLHYGTGSEQIVAALLAHGAKAEVVSRGGNTPLLGAVARPDSFAVAKRLLDAGAAVNARRVAQRGVMAKANALALAILGGDRRTIALLIERGAEVNPTTGVTPLTVAASTGDFETIHLLIKNGAKLDTVSPFQGTALNAALLSGHDAIARWLIEQGADPRLKTVRGHGTPPIVLSAYNDTGDAAITRLLVGHGVEVNAVNDAGETALSYALKTGPDTELVRYLREIGAQPAATPVRSKIIPSREVPVAQEARVAMLRGGAQRAIDLLQRNSTAFLENRFVREQAKCITCHQQALPAVAFGLARDRGLRVDEHELGRQLNAQRVQRTEQFQRALELDEPTPAAPVALGYDADGLSALHCTTDEMTEAMSHYLLSTQGRDGSWGEALRRPPMQDGAIIATAWASRAVQLYPPAGREIEVDEALRRSRAWLMAQAPTLQNERVFQLLGLAWAKETKVRMQPLVDALIGMQRADGGWAQLSDSSCDSWATGSALVALYKAGMPPTHPAYQRGVEFLLRTQFDDGSWWVRSRAWPFQPHFDGKFPHGKDQWISAAGTAWATIALLNTLDPTVDPATQTSGQQLIATFNRQTAKDAKHLTLQAVAPSPATTIDFVRDIQPLLERSCIKCHSGARPKGLFDLTTRAGLLKGGQSGEPAIAPGYAEESPLLHQILGEIEDLEMPPLNRRNKFPGLTPEEAALVRTWIDAGAVWPSAPSASNAIVPPPTAANELPAKAATPGA